MTNYITQTAETSGFFSYPQIHKLINIPDQESAPSQEDHPSFDQLKTKTLGVHVCAMNRNSQILVSAII